MVIDFNKFKNEKELVIESTLSDIRVAETKHLEKLAELFPELFNDAGGLPNV